MWSDRCRSRNPDVSEHDFQRRYKTPWEEDTNLRAEPSRAHSHERNFTFLNVPEAHLPCLVLSTNTARGGEEATKILLTQQQEGQSHRAWCEIIREPSPPLG